LGCLNAARRRNLQTVFSDGERRADDYQVRYMGRTIGRIYRMNSTGRELWRWTQIRLAQPSPGPERQRGR
jgi:hypothetical protein